ncbi:hypothetical protein cyc_01865 [Cyclospora cayetanensis]|uniref:Sel1 repeat-containing protein n=1 Tax=Cyclospora cayetanensis TaxID=88456 RepID=A0A1D3D3P2_9EIME|nr:hypothetical protein cyc_01865 [Cyclospora cayetanensis]
MCGTPRGALWSPSLPRVLWWLSAIFTLITPCTAHIPWNPGPLEHPPVAAAFAAVEDGLKGSPLGSSFVAAAAEAPSSNRGGKVPPVLDRYAAVAVPLGFREPLSQIPNMSTSLFYRLADCADTDPRDDSGSSGRRIWERLQESVAWISGGGPWSGADSGASLRNVESEKRTGSSVVLPGSVTGAIELLLSAPDFSENPPLPLMYLHAAAVATHPAAAAAVAWRHQFAALEGSVGQQQQACAAAANHYLPVAKATAGVYASGIPQAIEVLRVGGGGLNPTEASEVYRLSTDPEQLTMLVHEANEGNLAVHALLGRKYLFGVDGFPQDYAKARYHLLAASRSSKGDSKGLLGYIYALGLGVEADLDEAAEWFFRGAKENQDPIAYNGLGLVYFFGTPLIDSSPSLAFEMFNKSATLNSPDGQLNVASLYLTGTGVSKSFVEALKWYTKAVRGGSTGAAYALGVMHLSGLGAVRDCPLAVGLLKLATERSTYFAHMLQRAHGAYEQNAFDEAAFNFLLLAEAGHEASQSNLAFLLDAGLTDIFFDGTLRRKRLHAQRFYEMAAAQGSISAQLRLGDFAFYGYGVRRRSSTMRYPSAFFDEKGASFEGWLSQQKSWLDEGERDFSEAAAFYRKVANSSTWSPSLAAKILESLLEETRILFLLLNLVAIALLLVVRAFVQALRQDIGLSDEAFRAAVEGEPGLAAEVRQERLLPHQHNEQQPLNTGSHEGSGVQGPVGPQDAAGGSPPSPADTLPSNKSGGDCRISNDHESTINTLASPDTFHGVASSLALDESRRQRSSKNYGCDAISSCNNAISGSGISTNGEGTAQVGSNMVQGYLSARHTEAGASGPSGAEEQDGCCLKQGISPAS